MADGIIVRRYNPKETTVTFGGYFITGFGEDMITASKDEDFVETSVGAQGDVVVNEINNQIGTVSITLQNTSPSKKTLTDAARTRKIAPLWVENDTIGVKVGGAYAQIINYPENELGTTAGDLTYEFRVFDYDVQPLDVDDIVIDTISSNSVQ